MPCVFIALLLLWRDTAAKATVTRGSIWSGICLLFQVLVPYHHGGNQISRVRQQARTVAGPGMSFCNLKVCHSKWQTSSTKAIALNPSQTVSLTGVQASKYMSLQGQSHQTSIACDSGISIHLPETIADPLLGYITIVFLSWISAGPPRSSAYVVMVSAKVPKEEERTRKVGSQCHMKARDGGGLREVTNLWARLPSQKQVLNDTYLKGLSIPVARPNPQSLSQAIWPLLWWN